MYPRILQVQLLNLLLQSHQYCKVSKRIQHKVHNYDFRWEPSILSQSIRDLTVAVIGTGRIGSIVAEILEKVITARLLLMIHFQITL